MTNFHLRHWMLIAVTALSGASVSGQLVPVEPGEPDQFVDLPVQEGGGLSVIVLPGGEPFHQTSRPVLSCRMMNPGGLETPTIVVLWDEAVEGGDAGGAVEHFYAISRDGETFPLVGPITYEIRLRFATFEPSWIGVGRPEGAIGADGAPLAPGEPGPFGDGEPAVPVGLVAPEGHDVYIVQFVTQPLDEYRAAIAAAGGVAYQWLADHSYITRLPTAEAVEAVRALPYVRWVGAYHPAYKLAPLLWGEGALAGLPSDDPATARPFNVAFFEPGQREAVAQAVAGAGGVVTRLWTSEEFLTARLTDAQLVQVIRMPVVRYASVDRPPQPSMDNARYVSGASTIHSTPRPSAPTTNFRGQGVTGEVMEWTTAPHTEFATIVWHGNLAEHYKPCNFVVDHGTNTYGLIFSRGLGTAQSNPTCSPQPAEPRARGMLPEGRGVFGLILRIFDEEEEHHVSRMDHTVELLSSPYEAVFQSNSWGRADDHLNDGTTYDQWSGELDDIILATDLTIFHAQGNFDISESNEEALAKNAIGVGGLSHGNDCDRANDTHSQTASEGPAGDGRVKPDLCHFDSNVYTTNAVIDYSGCSPPVCNNLCPQLQYTSSYTESFGGTSAATPITAGLAGLAFQMWHEQVFPGFGGGASVFASRPHASTMKALLINSAYQYDFTLSSPHPNRTLTRMRQGWGVVDLATLYSRRNNTFIIDESRLLQVTQNWNYVLEVPSQSTMPFKATLVYRDPGGTTSSTVDRINDLSLTVTSPPVTGYPNGRTYYGNAGLLTNIWSAPHVSGPANWDTKNTVENVYVQSPVAGNWTVQVRATEVNEDAHPATQAFDASYAPVVSGVILDLGEAAEWNGDGYVDGADLGALVDDFRARSADFNRDGVTSPADLSAFLEHYVKAAAKERSK
ncbi:MAG: S8 family serine peptidase [Phycisphaerales bacterium]|nr:S8 family serine peptidase [Phycisphaerales bacterium]